MTWFIDTGRFPVVASVVVGSYSGGSLHNPPAPLPEKREPFTAEAKAASPKKAKAFPRSDGFKEHIIGDPVYFLLSAPAVDVLRALQPDGWEVVPIAISPYEKASADTFVGETYFLLNPYLHRNLVDLSHSDIPPHRRFLGTAFEDTVYRLRDKKHRRIAIKRDLVGDVCLWLGEEPVLTHTIFVADRLKEAWCDIGMNPAVFEPCLDV